MDLHEDIFDKLVEEAISAIPPRYSKHMNNVGFVVEDEPSLEQRQKLHLVDGVTLYGLYEGIPLTMRTSNYSGVLPDKITLFKHPIVAQAYNQKHLAEIIKNTVWHEVAHHFGLDHGRIHALESKAE